MGNHVGIPSNRYRRSWPFQAAMLPFYFLAPQILEERAFYRFFPLWKAWLGRQQFPPCNVVQAIMGYATEPFDRAEEIGALKVLDCPNSHPVTYQGLWQRECDLWCPGEKLPISQWMFARMNREFERADIVIAQSKFCKESMIMNGIPADKIIVNLMGVDLSIFSRRVTVPRKVRFLSVGTICLRKGHQYLFRAWEIVKRTLPEAELICVGNYKSDFRKERPKWEGRFTHLQHVPQTEVAKLLQSSTAFVFPSQEEGIARAQVEALACGVPVIGTHEGGATTLVDNGVEGFIVRGRDPEHIAAAMIRIANERDLNEKMGLAAYSKMAEQSSWQQYGDRLLARYAIAMCDREGVGNASLPEK
jgi:glycosyltransferase involved in cell wall biosynthesis